jgi:hypothetical protein
VPVFVVRISNAGQDHISLVCYRLVRSGSWISHHPAISGNICFETRNVDLPDSGGALLLIWRVCLKMETLLRFLDNGSAEFKASLDDNAGEEGNLIVDTT